MSAIIAIVILIALGGGVSLAAEQAKPGQPLYPVKITVNEGLRMAVAMSAKEKMVLDAAFAERRLEEAEQVAAEGTLKADVRARIEENFFAHADRVEARIKDFEGRDLNALADIATKFETSLEAHDRILTTLFAKADDNAERAEIDALATKVRSEERETAELRGEVEARVTAQAAADVRAAAEGKLNAAEKKISETRAFIEAQKASLWAEAAAAAEARLTVAESTIVQGRQKLEAAAYNDAFILFSIAERTAIEAQVLMTNQLRLRTQVETDQVETGARAETEAEVEAEKAGVELDLDADIEVR